MGQYRQLTQALNRHSLVYTIVYTLIFLGLSGAWIVLSDNVAALLAQTKVELAVYQHYKGLFYVTGAGLIFGLMTYLAHHRGIRLEHALRSLKTDPVTGLANRRVAEVVLDGTLSQYLQAGEHCGVILLDIRNLKKINLAYGHAGGDRLLQHVAHWLQQLIRASDYVARMEGDRFLIVLAPLADADELRHLSGYLQQTMPPVSIEADKPVEIELNAGAALAPDNGRTALELLDVAERALQRIKQSGQKYGLVIHDDLISDDSDLELESQLRRAIKEQQFSVVFQPIVDLDSLEVHGAEVLARWHPPGRDAVPPGEFIPLAESLGLIQDITEQIFTLTASHVADWHERGLACHLNLNLSGVDLMSPRIRTTANKLLADSHAGPAIFTLEITESWLMEDAGQAICLFESLRQQGFCIAIDDFGTGYSSLSHLLAFPLAQIKIDRVFIDGCARSQKKRNLIQLIQGIADSLGASTTAEGVETVDDLRVIRQLGVDMVQGFVFARPLPADVFVRDYLQTQTPLFQSLREALQEPVSN